MQQSVCCNIQLTPAANGVSAGPYEWQIALTPWWQRYKCSGRCQGFNHAPSTVTGFPLHDQCTTTSKG